mgnify:CR=1 FL=1
MSRQHHYLKTETEFYQAAESKEKLFEARRNDRNYTVGDMVYLQEVVRGVPTGRQLDPMEITYVLEGDQYGIEPEWCVFQLEPFV